MRAAEQIQLASLRHVFYLVGYGASHSQVDRLTAFCSALRTRSIFVSGIGFSVAINKIHEMTIAPGFATPEGASGLPKTNGCALERSGSVG
jgi:hypothetical protein